MAYIANFLNERLQAKEAGLLIDETLMRLKQRSKLLDKYMPLRTYDSDEFLAYVTEKLTPVASLVAPGAESPVVSHGTFRRLIGELTKLSLSYQFDEVIQKQMKKAMEEASLRGIGVQNYQLTDGSTMKGSNDVLVKYLYGHIEGLVQAHVDRLESMAWEVVQTGALNVEDPRTRVRLDIDFKRGEAATKHFPSALVKTGDLVNKWENKWTDYENADGLQNLFDAMDQYIDTNGFKPDAIIMSWKLRVHLLKQKTVIEAAKSSGKAGNIGAVSPDALKELLTARELPEIITYDEFFQEEMTPQSPAPFAGYAPVPNTSDPVIRNVRFLAENKFVFVKENMGEKCMGTPMEASSPIEGKISHNSSIVVRVKQDKDIPPLDTMSSISVCLPVIFQPKYLFARTVI